MSVPNDFNYEAIKVLAKQRGCKVADLIVLAPQNDPFYVGAPNDLTLGKWFTDLWCRFGYTAGVHLRRVHYQIISQDPPVLLPNGKPFGREPPAIALHTGAELAPDLVIFFLQRVDF